MPAFARSRRREVGATALHLAGYVGALALLAALVVKLWPVSESTGQTKSAAGQQWWVEVERPQPAFAMAFPDIPGARSTYRIMRDPVGGGRKDIIAVDGGGRSARVEILRPGRGPMAAAAPEIEIAQHAAAIGVVAGAESAPSVETRIGAVSLVDFSILDGERTHGCLGFMRRVPEAGLQISGWVCHAGPGMVARTAVICALDKLTMLSAGGDAKLAQFFAQAELKDPFCVQKRAPAGASADWLDRHRAARIRGTVR